MTQQYELHPLCTLFPRMSGADYDSLVADIKTNGLRQSIVLYDGMILDGGNRYRACIDAGIDPRFTDFMGADIVAYVLSVNLHRRHMSPSQQAAIVACAQDWAASAIHGGDRKTDQVLKRALETTEKRATASGASVTTQRRADAVAKADPELAKKVAAGEVRLSHAVEQVAPTMAAKPKPADNSTQCDRCEQVSELCDTVRALSAEKDALQDRIAVEAMEFSEEEKSAAAETIIELRATVTTLRAEVSALKASRDTYQRESAELKRQCSMQRRELEKVRRSA